MKQYSAREADQRGDMFVVDRDQQRYLLVNCRGAVVMQLPLQRADGEDSEEDLDPEMNDDRYGLFDQHNDEGIDPEDYQDDLPEDQGEDYYDQSNEDEEQPLDDGSMESLEQYV